MAQRVTGARSRNAGFVAILAMAVTLAGCDIEKTRNLIDDRANTGEAQENLLEAREAQPNAKQYNPLIVTDKVWAGNSPATRMHRGMPLPDKI